MKSIRTLFVTALIACWPMTGQAATWLIVGDSISAAYGIDENNGWVSLLRERLQAKDKSHRVINASISGETTGGGLARLPELLQRHKPDFVVIELGGNDGLRGYPVPRIRANLQRMIAMTREASAQPLLFGMQIPPNYGRRYVEAFRAMFGAVAEEEEVPLVPFFLADVALKRNLMQADGIHPRAEAQPILLENAWPVIEATLANSEIN